MSYLRTKCANFMLNCCLDQLERLARVFVSCAPSANTGDRFHLHKISVFTIIISFDQFNFDEFMESWQQSVPDGMTTSLEQLKVRYWHKHKLSKSVFRVIYGLHHV